MSTTDTQRELIDYLWEWAESKEEWAKLLVKKITNCQNTLSLEDRQEIFNYYLQSIDFTFNPVLPTLNLVKPIYSSNSKEVVLTKLSEIKGVNKLADDQALEFSPNLTVIYGNNGVGKTGFSRILKAQGYSFDNNSEILSNVNQTQVRNSAKIEFTSDNDPFFLNWEGGKAESDLNAISVFNSDCVNISLLGNRELLVTPKGFHLFTLVTNELSKLRAMHTEQFKSYPIELEWSENLNENTPQQIFINSIAHNTPSTKLDELSLFVESHQKDLAQKEKELKSLNKPTIEANLAKTNLILSEFGNIFISVKHAQLNLTKPVWGKINEHNTKLKALKAKTQLGIATLAESNNLEKFNTDEFISFLKSADVYIKLLKKENYPNNHNDKCVYCKQDLQEVEARNLITSYSKLLNDTTQDEIGKIEKLKALILDKINLVNENILFNQPTFGLAADDTLIQPKEITNYNSKVKFYKDHILNDTVDEAINFNIDYTNVLDFLVETQTKFTKEREELSKSLKNLAPFEIKLKSEIAELKDRKLLSSKKKAVLKAISNLRAHKTLQDNIGQFNSTSLSHKTTQARQELIAKDFQDKFTSELTGFRKQNLGVSLSFFSQQGGSRLRQSVAQFEINRVLSEGEQKTIALCEFLTELNLDKAVAPVVFDDPVNSLDHHIIYDVAKRLVELSKDRQVVIFTHNVIFYNSFFTHQKNPVNSTVNFKFYKVDRSGEQTGILSDGTPINKLGAYKTKLNVICNNGLNGRMETDVAAEGYDYLRTGIELLVSNTIFKEIVGRYRNNIMMTKFPAVKGDMIEKHKAEIDAMFSRSSAYIRAHSHPEEHNAPPSMADLQADYGRFKQIEADF